MALVPGRNRCGRGVPRVLCRLAAEAVRGGGRLALDEGVRLVGGTVFLAVRRLRLPPTDGVVGVRGVRGAMFFALTTTSTMCRGDRKK